MNKVLCGALWLLLLLFFYKFMFRHFLVNFDKREEVVGYTSPLTPYKRITIGNGLKTIECCDERNLYIIFDGVPRTEGDFIPAIQRNVRPVLKVTKEPLFLNDNTLYVVEKNDDGRVVVSEMNVNVLTMLHSLNLEIFK